MRIRSNDKPSIFTARIFREPKVSFRKSCYQFICLVLAANYFAFQVELFEEEYEANHPTRSEGAAYSAPTTNWESFDKNNAPQAFVVDAGLQIEFLFTLVSPAAKESPSHSPFHPVRDKSPPSFPL